MSRDNWYRNEMWDAGIDAAFRKKLSRSRSGKPQYLIIQAGHLTRTAPVTALLLIDEYFTTNDTFHVSTAYGVRAAAQCRLGSIKEAVVSFKQALAWEADHPGLITNSRLDYPQLVAEHNLCSEYENALMVLVGRFEPSDFAFPVSRFRWNGCQALIRAELGQAADARHFAERALVAASETESPFRYHRSLGLVSNTDDDFGRRIKRIARPSGLRRFMKVLGNPTNKA